MECKFNKSRNKDGAIVGGRGRGRGTEGGHGPQGFEKGPPPPYNLYENKIIC